ncbi:MAG: ABC transporter permease subunit [Planctomycetota bacterium]|jgi:ABC-type transport system involved in multi-copper enzyme maturation permease subunit
MTEDKAMKGGPAACFRTPAVPSNLQAALRVFRNTCFECLHGRRGVMLTLLALLPILLMLGALLFNVERGGGSLFFIITLVTFYHYINMIFYIFLGCSALGESLEDKTITYELICPVPRSMIFAGRIASYWVSTMVIILPVICTAYFVSMVRYGGEILVRNLPSLAAVVLMTCVAALVYGSVFMVLSLLLKRAIYVAIILAVVVDGFIAYLPLRVAALSPQIHLKNLMALISGDDRFRIMIPGVEPIELAPGISVVVLVMVWLFFTGLGGVLFSRKQLI